MKSRVRIQNLRLLVRLLFVALRLSTARECGVSYLELVELLLKRLQSGKLYDPQEYFNISQQRFVQVIGSMVASRGLKFKYNMNSVTKAYEKFKSERSKYMEILDIWDDISTFSDDIDSTESRQRIFEDEFAKIQRRVS